MQLSRRSFLSASGISAAGLIVPRSALADDRFGNFIASAGLVVASGIALIASAAAAPAVAAAGGIALALWSIGTALALIGAAIGLAGVATALWEEGGGGDGYGPKDPGMCGTEWKPYCDISA